jgi:hypothetical protein
MCDKKKNAAVKMDVIKKKCLKGEALVVNTFWWATEQIYIINNYLQNSFHSCYACFLLCFHMYHFIQPWGSIRSSDPIWPRGVRRGARWSPDEG